LPLSKAVTSTPTLYNAELLRRDAAQQLANQQYAQAASSLEQLIEHEPQTLEHYWHLGLAYLLQGREDEAQSTWLFALAQVPAAQTEQRSAELQDMLRQAANQQYKLQHPELSWTLRQYLFEIDPADVENLLSLVRLELELQTFVPESLARWQLADLVQQAKIGTLDPQRLLDCLQALLSFPGPDVLDFAKACLPHIPNREQWIDALLVCDIGIKGTDEAFVQGLFELGKACTIEDLRFWQALSKRCQEKGYYPQSIAAAKEFLQRVDSPPLQLLGNYLLLGALTKAGSWQELKGCLTTYQQLMTDIIDVGFEDRSFALASCLSIAPSLLQYYQDSLAANRQFQNQLSQLAQDYIQPHRPERLRAGFLHGQSETRPLKLGFIGHTFRVHSVGWLFRWLYQALDRTAFATHLYLVNQDPNNEFRQRWFNHPEDCIRSFQDDESQIAEGIYDDRIDILIDLDSNSSSITNMVMAFKPAPIQASWLGYDASGIPAIDYFIADPYVLPESAEAHYQEKIWRLPQTYLAINGFEVDIPTLRRDHLGIPADAIIYLSAQTGYKRHPDTIRLQMQIIKQVPHSFFLIKGGGDQQKVQQLFITAAEAEGVNPDRLRFLENDPNEFIHRANLQIADIILDTYPYNGATTTLEAMWMGIPLVTKVGEQFAARNSYAFLTQAGVTDGIAWTDEAYVDWGIRLGSEPALRCKMTWQLLQSRQTSPLWNTRQFARQMEAAYQQMWRRYCDQT
jgi:predicted O-linked N-acetylglucosamine transferase (SPINDLY family)